MSKISVALNRNFFQTCIIQSKLSPDILPRRLYQTLLHQTNPEILPSNLDRESYDKNIVPFRKHLKDLRIDSKQKEIRRSKKFTKQKSQKIDDWELTVGIEIHALLNTERKIFSPAPSTINHKANTSISLFDIATPGSQPIFQKETLIPAIRAALICNCEVQTTSKFDRKHYFHWDQPAGYQITQYYEPFAKDGYIDLFAHDSIAEEDGDHIRVRIKQIQLEQDTAKTISKPEVHLLDFNRAGLPLIEIITHPELHYPKTAAALVRKIQLLLESTNACIVGMESGGLRADINVSVRHRDESRTSLMADSKEFLNQKTEIKNLSSFKSIEDSIIAERDRQISVLQRGGTIASETRGWAIGATETKKLRDKEGEVDYRYMPDPDLPPLVIGHDAISYLKSTMGISLDEEIDILVNKYGLTAKDAVTLVSLENGGRAEFFYKVVESLQSRLPLTNSEKIGRLCSNWILHDMASLRHSEADERNPLSMKIDGSCIIPSDHLVSLLLLVETGKILRKPAKYVLRKLFTSYVEKVSSTPEKIIQDECLWHRPVSEDHYKILASSVLDQHQGIRDAVLSGNKSKIKILLGFMLKTDIKGVLDPDAAEKAITEIIEERKSSI